MTLCIAVKCQDMGEQRVVCCFDAQVGNDEYGTETEQKWHQLTPSICAMYAGRWDLARDVIKIYKSKLKRSKITTQNYRSVLRKPMDSFFVDDSFEPDGDVDLLAVARVDGDLRIVQINRRSITVERDFYAVGTGAPSATALLKWRKVSPRTDLNAALYFAYEAKRIGEVSPFVGKIMTYLYVLNVKSTPIIEQILTTHEVTQLAEAFKRFGPQEFDYAWRLSPAAPRDR